MDVSVIIVNYKTVPLILNCLESLQAKTEKITYEVIVVDNNSGDDFQGRILDRFPEVRCLPLPENVGFGRANNEGLKIAKGRKILFLNPDTLLLNNAIKILSDYLDGHPQVGVCGGNLYDEDMDPAHSYRMMLPSIKWELNGLLHGLIEKCCWASNSQFNYTGNPLSVGYITGADMMVRREVLDQVGVFSPLFFMYYEETELSFRIKEAGFDIVSVPGAQIQHLEGKSFGGNGINRWKIRCQEESHRLYYQLTSRFAYRWCAYALYCVTLLSHLPFNIGDKKRFRIVWFRLWSFLFCK